jgi:hypothetical protein
MWLSLSQSASPLQSALALQRPSVVPRLIALRVKTQEVSRQTNGRTESARVQSRTKSRK